jgi:hypothetical protein
MPRHPPTLTRRVILAGAAALAAVAILSPASNPAADPYAELAPDAVEKMLGAADARIYDANPRDVYEQHHLPGAVFIGHEKDLARHLPADKATRLVFYCAGPK